MTFFIMMTPSCVVWSVIMLNVSWPPTILYSISALRPTSGSSALMRPMAPPISVDSTVVTRKESETADETVMTQAVGCACVVSGLLGVWEPIIGLFACLIHNESLPEAAALFLSSHCCLNPCNRFTYNALLLLIKYETCLRV